MTKSAEHLSQQYYIPSVPEPSAASASEGSQWGQELARRCLPDDVRLCAAIAFGDGAATMWTRLQAARLIAQIAGARYRRPRSRVATAAFTHRRPMIDLQAGPIIGLSGVMTSRSATGSLAAQRRREGRREEWTQQTKLARMLASYLDLRCTFWTSLENKPLSLVSGIFQRRRGVKSGLPDMLVLQRKPWGVLIVFVELKSRSGVGSKVQKQVRAELLQAGAVWWMARSARAAMTALHRSGVVFRRPWEPPPLHPWEGPFADPNQQLPQAPEVAARRRAAQRAWRERRRRARETEKLAAERSEAAGTDVAA